MFLIRKPALAALSAFFVLAQNSGVNSFAPSPTRIARPNTADSAACLGTCDSRQTAPTTTQLQLKLFTKTEEVAAAAVEIVDESSEGDWVDESKKVELILLGIWGVSISAFILINNFQGPWPLAMKAVPERVFFLSHMIGGMLFGGGIILTTCIERLVAKSNNPGVLQFWFDKVPELDGLIVVPALTISMVSGTGLSIVRYGGLNVAPPHVGAIFWTLIAFMSWWAATDLTTQGTALKEVERMYARSLDGETGLETPKVVVDRHVSNVVSCFFILTLYSMMVLKPGTLLHYKDLF